MSLLFALGVLVLVSLAGGCTTATTGVHSEVAADPPRSLSSEQEEKILALDARHVTARDVNEVLSGAPAPKIIVLHGGIFNFSVAMKSFSQFLIGMGYPETCIKNPRSGDYTYDCYEPTEKFAGLIGWYLERDGLRPMIIGHSVGGVQTVKILHTLAAPAVELRVWNPLTGRAEPRTTITNRLTGATCSLTNLQVSYASALAAGGFALAVTEKWKMADEIREVPDTVEEFTGFSIGMDLIGGDDFGFGPLNDFHPTGHAAVRNVHLPAGASHSFLPAAARLLKNASHRDWINNYTPGMEPTGVSPATKARMIWAADVWHSVKKHWVLELQNLIRARRDAHVS